MSPPKFLTTREVADLLRVKERKIYELAANATIPVSRATGKLLFPRDLVEMWVRRQVEYAGDPDTLVPRPLVIAGSHDPLLDWALRESGAGIATFFDGSMDGLARLASGEAVAAAVHLRDPRTGEWNYPDVERAMPGRPVVLVEWSKRRQGLVVPAGNPRRVNGLSDLAGMRFIPRQANAGARRLLEHLLEDEGVDSSSISQIEPPARSETDVGLAVSEGKADIGFAVETVAHQLRLGFVPIVEERFDLAVWRREYFEPPMQRLLAFARSDPFRVRADELRGYDVSALGMIHYNGP